MAHSKAVLGRSIKTMKYKTAFDECDARAEKLLTFKVILLTCTPHTKKSTPTSDVSSKNEKLNRSFSDHSGRARKNYSNVNYINITGC